MSGTRVSGLVRAPAPFVTLPRAQPRPPLLEEVQPSTGSLWQKLP